MLLWNSIARSVGVFSLPSFTHSGQRSAAMLRFICVRQNEKLASHLGAF